MKTVAILQSNYIPWKGYFDLIAAVDEFILYDDMQYTKRDWRNRNKIKTPAGEQWLTVPVKVKGKFLQSIRETEIDGSRWAAEHWRGFAQNYSAAPHFEEVSKVIEPFYRERIYPRLSSLNRDLILCIAQYLGIKTKISNSWDYQLIEGKTERLADLCRQAGAQRYISGPAAKTYIVPEAFTRHGIELNWFNYDDYPVYPQLWDDFTHSVSILDLLFNCGKESHKYMKYVRP